LCTPDDSELIPHADTKILQLGLIFKTMPTISSWQDIFLSPVSAFAEVIQILKTAV
jgi:hypothetical protein